MLVVTLTDCPPKLRGDLSKWLIEINTGVYVGRVSARVRMELWKRIRENLPHGRATMVYSAANEQRMAFLVHNTTWEPTDYDGLTLMRRPLSRREPTASETNGQKSKATVNEQLRGIQAAHARKEAQLGYVAIDLETTGLDSETDDLMELAAVRVIDHQPAEKLCVLIKPERAVPEQIIRLTGITPQMLAAEGIALEDAMARFWAFVGASPMVSHNSGFDRLFLEAACKRTSTPFPRNRYVDTLRLARRYLEDVRDYKLATVAAYFGISVPEEHRALADCLTTYQVYEKLNEI